MVLVLKTPAPAEASMAEESDASKQLALLVNANAPSLLLRYQPVSDLVSTLRKDGARRSSIIKICPM
jgi:hypothetical protein